MGLNLHLNTSSYYGVTSFHNITAGKQNTKNSPLSAIYNASSQASQLNALTSAMGSLRSAAAGASGAEQKSALYAKLGNITTAMKNSFNLSNTSFDYTPTDTRSIREVAKEQAEEVLRNYTPGKKFDEYF